MNCILDCPYCDSEILEDKPVYCPFCGERLKQVRKHTTSLPIAGGILAIIAGCAAIVAGLIGMLAVIYDVGWYYFFYYPPNHHEYLLGAFGIIAFVFGVTGGVCSIRRRFFALSIVGISLALVCGFATITEISWDGIFGSSLPFGLPTIILSMLGLIFVAFSKGEFRKNTRNPPVV